MASLVSNPGERVEDIRPDDVIGFFFLNGILNPLHEIAKQSIGDDHAKQDVGRPPCQPESAVV
jgi:hypothetical protein